MLRWHWTRWLRLGLGLAFIGQGIASGEAFAYGAGAFFSLQAVLNTGCCTAGTGEYPAASKAAPVDEPTYQEIK